MKKYAIVIEQTERNYAAYVPDLPGCVATGTTVEETEQFLAKRLSYTSRGCVRMVCPCPNHRA